MTAKSKNMEQRPENNKNPPKETKNEKDDEIRNKLSSQHPTNKNHKKRERERTMLTLYKQVIKKM